MSQLQAAGVARLAQRMYAGTCFASVGKAEGVLCHSTQVFAIVPGINGISVARALS